MMGKVNEIPKDKRDSRTYFIVCREWQKQIDGLTDELCGELLHHMYLYELEGRDELDQRIEEQLLDLIGQLDEEMNEEAFGSLILRQTQLCLLQTVWGMIRDFYEKTDSTFVKRSKANSLNARTRWEKEKSSGQDDESIADTADNTAAAVDGGRQKTEDHYYSADFGVPYNSDGDYGNIDTGIRNAASMNKDKEPDNEDYSITEIFGNPDIFR